MKILVGIHLENKLKYVGELTCEILYEGPVLDFIEWMEPKLQEITKNMNGTLEFGRFESPFMGYFRASDGYVSSRF